MNNSVLGTSPEHWFFLQSRKAKMSSLLCCLVCTTKPKSSPRNSNVNKPNLPANKKGFTHTHIRTHISKIVLRIFPSSIFQAEGVCSLCC